MTYQRSGRPRHRLVRQSLWKWIRNGGSLRRTHGHLIQTVLPESWQALPSCGAIIHVTEGDVMAVLSPSQRFWKGWVAGHIGAHFGLGTLPVLDERLLREALLGATRWLPHRGEDRGLRLSHLEIRRTSRGTELMAKGRWGRGRKTLIRAGKARGDAFSQQWPLATNLLG